ncbi:MAG: glucose/galactose MFS transporter [Bacteroidetes bacterium HGW-Bacteroidetes-6]|jgi:glucose/galactose transporter|nr:MAG: glucose/galactose MFS transporter [Bacteroidetes bacterium HGW-Bacteroidetes-6]
MNQQNKSGQTFALFVIGVFFFIFGFVTWLNGVLIPFLRTACELTTTQAFFVATAFYIAYFVMAIPVSFILKKFGFVNSMSLGLLIMILGSLIFIPAAYSREYGLFLVGLFVQGTGLTMLQTAVNPYVTLLGPVESAAKRISIMGVANKLAGAFSGIILGSVLLSKSDEVIQTELSKLASAAKSVYLDELAQKVVIPYIIMAVVLAVLALMVRYARLPEISGDEPEAKFTTKGLPAYAWLGVFAIFFYVGAEVVVGDSIILYGRYLNPDPFLINLFGWEINMLNPSYFTSYVMAGMILGYFIGIVLIPKIISQQKALQFFAISAITFASAALITSGTISLFFIVLLGISNSVMWPAIWPLAIEKTGNKTPIISALLIMGIIGGAIMSPLFGKLADLTNMHLAYLILIPCYLYILFYAVSGHKTGKQI